ncbi:hypothetical protein KJ877_02610 [bacterium]|nr:hypothetical protein [bacterium]MBU1990618.1 hypothetical protein [bacterium]
MSWLNFFETKTELKHPFGRGINASLADDEEELFNKSYEAFAAKDILSAYEYFFRSLQNYTDNHFNENISFVKKEDTLNFEIYQGTAKISGYITSEHIYAESILTKKEHAFIALKRYILERNYQLTYAKYFADNEYIKLKLYHDNITMSPQKVFFPLRELALNADFDKEYTKNEFPNTLIEDIEHLKPVNEKLLQLKYDSMQAWIQELENKILTFPTNDNAGMQSFSYLCLLFKIDYLIVPKYEIYQKMSKIIQEYFSDENSTTEAKNEELKKYVEILKKMDFENFSKNFYDAKYTFNPMEKTSHEEINIFINESLTKIRWYKNNRYNLIIPTIYKYIAFYLLYNYGLHPVTKDLLHTLVEIQNSDFFQELNYNELYNQSTNSFSKRTIISRVNEIITPYKKRFKMLKPFGNELNFTSLNEFSNSFYIQITNLNFEEI